MFQFANVKKNLSLKLLPGKNKKANNIIQQGYYPQIKYLEQLSSRNNRF